MGMRHLLHLELLPRQSPTDSSEEYTIVARLLWLVVAYLFDAFAFKLFGIRCIGALKQSNKQKQIDAQKQPILQLRLQVSQD